MVYTTTQTHSLGAKAALILGLRERSLEVFSEDEYGLSGETLRQALEEDQKNGNHPFILSKLPIVSDRPDRFTWANFK